MSRKCLLLFFVLLINVSLLAQTKYETVVLQSNDDVVSILKNGNKKYVISHDYDLKGKEVVIGANSILVFQGGSLSNGRIRGNQTILEAGLETIFCNIENTGTFQCLAVYPQWFGAKADGKHDCSSSIQQAIDFAVNSYVVGNPWDIQQNEGNCLKVEIPAGSYLLKQPIYMRDYTHLEGQGRGITKLVNGGVENGRTLVYRS